MMKTAGFLVIPCLYLGMFAYKAIALLRGPRNPFLTALCAALLFAGLGTCVQIPVVNTALETSTGILVAWLVVPIIASDAALRTTLLLCACPLPQARRKSAWGLVLYGFGVIAIIGLALAARGHINTAENFRYEAEPEQLWASVPYARDAYLVAAAVMAFTYAEAVVRIVMWVRLVDRRWLRRGLWTLGAGFALLTGELAAVVGYFISVRLDMPAPALLSVSYAVTTIAAMVITAGVVLPVLGPRLDRMMAYRRLEPLWALIHQALPHISLQRRPGQLDRWNPMISNLRVYRRVIEIRDGLLMLRVYFDPDVGVEVRQRAEAGHYGASNIETIVQAAQLRAAIRHFALGLPPCQIQAESFFPAGGNDLDEELATLVPLADALSVTT